MEAFEVPDYHDRDTILSKHEDTEVQMILRVC